MSWRHWLHQKGQMLKEEEGRDEMIETLGGKYRMPLYSVQEELGTGVKAKHSRPLIRKYSNAEILSGIISKVNKKKKVSVLDENLEFRFLVLLC